jgi:hypothetical protein
MNKILFLLLILSTSIVAENEISFLENSRMTWELSSRSSYFERDRETTFQHFAGVDFFKTFNNGHKDVAFLVLQPYLQRIDNGQRIPGFYDDGHDWEFIFRTVALTYTGLGTHFPWLKIGHFEVPFGLEYTKNTFGNLHQYGQVRKLGIKVDWGLALGQELENWQYEIALTRGSGIKYRDREGAYAFAGRIGTLDDDYWGMGVSFFLGELLRGKTTQERKLISWDAQYYWKRWGFLSEIYTGEIDNNKTLGALWEINWRTRDDSLTYYSQYQFQDTQTVGLYSAVTCGATYKMNERVVISSQFTFELNQPKDRGSIFELQLRYLF